MRRMCTVLLAIAVALSMAMTVFPAEVKTEHWAASAAEKWQEEGIIQGDAQTGDIRLDDSMSRAEFAVLLGRMMGYYETAERAFTDLEAGIWYTDPIAKAAAAGVISGYPDGTVRPAGMVNRQEAAVMLCRAFGIVPEEGAVDFTDWQDVAEWAKGPVRALYARGVIQGYDGKFFPWEPVTRAQMLSMIDRLIEEVITESGTISHDVRGSLLVNSGGVRLENMTIDGDLIIADGVGDGDIYAKNVKVGGNIVLRGCGENSFHLLGDFTLGGKLIVTKTTNGAIRVVNESGKTIPIVLVNDGKAGVVITGKIGTLVVVCDTPVSLEDAVVGTVSVTANNAAVTVGKNSSVSRLAVAAGAENTRLNVAGKVTTLDLNAEVTLDRTGTISSIQLAPGVSQPVDSDGNTVTATGGGSVSAQESFDTSTLPVPTIGEITFDPHGTDEIKAYYEVENLIERAGVSYIIKSTVHTDRYFSYDADTGTYTPPFGMDWYGSDKVTEIHDGRADGEIWLGSYAPLAENCQGIAKEEWNAITLTVQACYEGTEIEGKSSSKTLAGDEALLTILNSYFWQESEMPLSVPIDGKLQISAVTGRGVYRPYMSSGWTYEEDYPENFKAFLNISSGGLCSLCHAERPYINESGGIEWHFYIPDDIDLKSEKLRAEVQYVWSPPDKNLLVLCRSGCNKIELIDDQG